MRGIHVAPSPWVISNETEYPSWHSSPRLLRFQHHQVKKAHISVMKVFPRWCLQSVMDYLPILSVGSNGNYLSQIRAWEKLESPAGKRVQDFGMKTSSNGNIFRVTGPLCGNSPVIGEFPSQRLVTRGFDVFFYLRLNKVLSKQSWG